MTIAQQLNVTTFPLTIEDKDGKEIYCETSEGFWTKHEFDAQGNIIRFENSNGFWIKREYDANGNEIYYEDSTGYIKDNRPKIDQPTYLMLAQMRDRAKIAENQLAAVTEQRDRLAENLKQIYNVSSFDYDTMPEAARKKYREVVFAIADKALQSLTITRLAINAATIW